MKLRGVEYSISIMNPDIILESDEHDLVFFRGYAEIVQNLTDELEAEMKRQHGSKWEGRTDYSSISSKIDNEMIEEYVRDHMGEEIKFYNQ